MKTSVISDEFRERYLNNPGTRTPSRAAPSCSMGRRTTTTASTIRRSRSTRPASCSSAARPDRLSGAAEVVNMQPPALIKRGVSRCPASATAASPARRARRRSSTPRPRPRSAAGWRCCRRATASASISTSGAPTSSCRRRSWRSAAPISKRAGGYAYPASQTPWQEIQRSMVDQLSEGMVLKPAVKYQKVAQTFGVPRDNHLPKSKVRERGFFMNRLQGRTALVTAAGKGSDAPLRRPSCARARWSGRRISMLRSSKDSRGAKAQARRALERGRRATRRRGGPSTSSSMRRASCITARSSNAPTRIGTSPST